MRVVLLVPTHYNLLLDVGIGTMAADWAAGAVRRPPDINLRR